MQIPVRGAVIAVGGGEAVADFPVLVFTLYCRSMFYNGPLFTPTTPSSQLWTIHKLKRRRVWSGGNTVGAPRMGTTIWGNDELLISLKFTRRTKDLRARVS